MHTLRFYAKYAYYYEVMRSTNRVVTLVMLSEQSNHSSIAITKHYLGIRKNEIMECYGMLYF